jgi:hypothetical protein
MTWPSSPRVTAARTGNSRLRRDFQFRCALRLAGRDTTGESDPAFRRCILALAERVLPRAADLWVQASLEQRQRFDSDYFGIDPSRSFGMCLDRPSDACNACESNARAFLERPASDGQPSARCRYSDQEPAGDVINAMRMGCAAVMCVTMACARSPSSPTGPGFLVLYDMWVSLWGDAFAFAR